jgi:CoA:oxalate CoA-transferase
MAADPRDAALPLSGITVLDVSQIYNGPYATFLMAMAGAEVIKVEAPGGEPLRRRNARKGSGIPFAMLNANKRAVVLDLKKPKGLALFLRLAESADVLVENFAPGVMARLGAGYETVSRTNPGIVYASGSGYGQTGPYRDNPAMDLTVQAMVGIVAGTGFPDGQPVKAGPAICDFLGGIHLYGAIVTALFHRTRTGSGRYIDVSMMEAAYPALASSIGGLYSSGPGKPLRTGNQHGGLSLCPYSVYPTTDGHLAIITNRDGHWQALCAAMGRTELAADPRYATTPARVARMTEVDGLVAAWTAGFDRDRLAALLKAHRVPCAPVQALSEVVSDPHLRARGMVFEVDHPEHGRVVMCRSPFHFDGLEQPAYRPTVPLGGDTGQVLGEKLGVGAAELAGLRDEGVV